MAVKIGQKIESKGIFSHVTEGHTFKDENLFYRFKVFYLYIYFFISSLENLF